MSKKIIVGILAVSFCLLVGFVIFFAGDNRQENLQENYSSLGLEYSYDLQEIIDKLIDVSGDVYILLEEEHQEAEYFQNKLNQLEQRFWNLEDSYISADTTEQEIEEEIERLTNDINILIEEIENL